VKYFFRNIYLIESFQNNSSQSSCLKSDHLIFELKQIKVIHDFLPDIEYKANLYLLFII
jgi:hypothetical protein